MNLRDQARGRPCMVRLPCCNHDPVTVVLAHARMPGITGIGQKAPDLLGAWTCSACHDAIDGRTNTFGREFARLAFFEGVIRTQYALIQEGIVQW